MKATELILSQAIILFFNVPRLDCLEAAESAKVLLWSVKYDFDDNAIKQIYGEPIVWIQQLLGGGAFKPRELSSPKLREYTALGIHVEKELVFWFDKEFGVLEYGDILFNTSGRVHQIKEITNVNLEVSAMAIDWINDKIYWSEYDQINNTSVIYRASILDPVYTAETVVSGELNHVTGLEIIPQLGYLFIADATRKVIYRRNVLNEDVEMFSLICGPSSISVDYDNEKLLVLCHGPQTGMIISYTWEGGDEQTIITRRSLLERGSLDTYKDLLFLTNSVANGFEIINGRTGVTTIDATLKQLGKTHDIKMFAPEKQPANIKYVPVSTEGVSSTTTGTTTDFLSETEGFSHSESVLTGNTMTTTESTPPGMLDIRAIIAVAVVSVVVFVLLLIVTIVCLLNRRKSKDANNKLNGKPRGSEIYDDIDDSKINMEWDKVRYNKPIINAQPPVPYKKDCVPPQRDAAYTSLTRTDAPRSEAGRNSVNNESDITDQYLQIIPNPSLLQME